MGEPYVSNVLSYKYDTALDFHVTMYDAIPYKRDTDYCNEQKIALYSGKVIKYYLYLCSTDVYPIDNKDHEIETILKKIQAEQAKQTFPNAVARAVASGADVTEQQIQTLLDDRSEKEDYFDDSFEESFEESNDIDAPLDSVNAFADVEDW